VIADLGNSQRIDESSDEESQGAPQRAISMVALEGSEVLTPQWSPPEILLQGKSPSLQADVYSLAVVLYEILTNEIPFDGEIVYSSL
jgi:serine/threonine protein kinase